MVTPPRFHTRPLRRTARQDRARRRRWRGVLTALGLLCAIAGAALVMRIPASAGDWQRMEVRFALCGERFAEGCVIDGDTILLGRGTAARRIRLTGFNAPEIKGECPAESALAGHARLALRDWLNAGPFALDGGDDPPRDRYGRELRAARRGQEWLANTMIESNLAQSTGWGSARGEWCG